MSISEAVHETSARGMFVVALLVLAPCAGLAACDSGAAGSATGVGSPTEPTGDASSDAGLEDVLVKDDGHVCATTSTPPECGSNRMLLTCDGGPVCISDAGTDCYGKTFVDRPEDGCTNHCCPDEVGVAVRGELPAGCRLVDIRVPSGSSYGCCPCR